MMPRLFRRALLTAGLLASMTLAACGGSSGSDDEGFSPPPGLVEAGTDIPETSVVMGMSPYADELLFAAGVNRGYFDDVSIDVGPGEFGAETDLIAALTPLLNDQIEVGSGYAPAIASQLDNVDNVAIFGIQDVFYGYRLLAPEGRYDTVADLMEGGATFQDAVTDVLDQVKGQDVILRDGVVPTFYNLIGEAGGTSMADWNVTYLPNPDIVRAAQSGQADFVSPTGAVEIVRLQNDGWEPLVDLRQVIDNLPAEDTVSLRSTFSGYLTTTEYAEANWETILRLTSVMYRLVDDLQADPEGTAEDFVDYVNSYTGSDLDAADLAATFDGLYSVRNFEEAEELFTDPDGEFNVDVVAGAQIDELAEQGVIGEGHDPQSLSIAGEVYDALVTYREEADQLLSDAGSSELWQRAQEQYDQRNYLDAYRFAAAAEAEQ